MSFQVQMRSSTSFEHNKTKKQREARMAKTINLEATEEFELQKNEVVMQDIFIFYKSHSGKYQYFLYIDIFIFYYKYKFWCETAFRKAQPLGFISNTT